MKKKIITVMIIYILFLLIGSINVCAKESDLKMMGTYTISAPVKQSKKIYIQEEFVTYFEEQGIEIEKETEGVLWWKKTKYSYVANEYVDEIVTVRRIYNDVDSMIFMVKELEKSVKEIKGNVDKNVVLGYIRSIAPKYMDGYFDKYAVICGDPHRDDINKIRQRENERVGIRLNEYFAQFLCGKDDYDKKTQIYDNSDEKPLYNVSLHGVVREQYRNKSEKALGLIDPSNHDKEIDLIHMFASIDGIYKNTEEGAFILFGTNKIERDIVSWNGDLQQACKKISDKINETNPTISSSTLKMPCYQKMVLMFEGDYSCSEDDILADIDAMNITKLYIDNENMGISDSLTAYYWLVSNNENFRFRTFVKSSIIDEEKKEKIDGKTEIERFELEISSQFNIKKENDEYYEHGYYNRNAYADKTQFRFMIKNDGTLVEDYVRVFVVKSFIEYVESNM